MDLDDVEVNPYACFLKFLGLLLLPIIPGLDFLLSPFQVERGEPEAELYVIKAINKKLQRSYN